MALRINTNVAAINAHRQLLVTEAGMNKSMERLSSGYRINKAADDAAGLAIANRLRANVKSLTVASRNVTEGKALLQIAEGSANQIESILERMKELAVQASSANAGTDRDKLDAEFQSLIDEIDRIVDDTNYQGTKLLDGNFDGTFQVGAMNAADSSGSSQINIAISGLDTTTLGISTAAVDSAAHADSAIGLIDDAINTLAGVLGDIGATMNRLDYTYSNLQVQIENFSAAESVIRDVDMASEMVTFTKSQILLQAGTAMLAQANMSSQVVLSLFG
ncbi:MAG TPA: flagellin [Deltaproteobacteria bacterium]|nr:flagellin [Deltaproteobacteria bacterium]HOM28853.1 flagellin [Deltaproteobacteria bacterium]HPP79531.1 flagellin [Deltaproteobacteria bacterium]